jgi:uncharacterized protein (DUF362 family)/Pyruvate/2-oxoacid:ferredoxin oxidoreductase delta subunit
MPNSQRTDNSVALVRCIAYEAKEVETAVRHSVDLLGGMSRFVKPGQRVLIKPNLLQPSDPAKAIITHPTVVRAVVKLVHEAGGRAMIADNPFVLPLTQNGWDSAYERAGWAAVAAETGAELNTQVIPQQRSHPDGTLIKLVDTSSFLTESDVVISLPKLKTHSFMRLTGAVKNLFGTVPGTIKAGYHVKLQTADRFADMLLDLASFVRPALTVMDAVVGMDGEGPSAGRPFSIGAILAAPDPVALDVAALSLVGHEPLSVPTVARAVARGWTTGQAADLALRGDDLAALRAPGFRLPAGRQADVESLPEFLRRSGTRLLVASPYVTGLCIGCRLCVEHCPVQSIAQVDGQARIHLDNCIRCYCCHEVCPEHAIALRQPWLGRVLANMGR